MLGNGKFWSKVMVLAFCCCMQACKGGGNVATQMPPPSQGQSSAELHLISAAPNGGTANGPSFSPTMSDDGRFVAFSSQATNLLSGAVIGAPNANSIYLYDSCQGAGETCAPKTFLATVAENGGIPDGPCGTSSEQSVATNTDGRYYAFACVATNMVPQPNNGHSQVLLSDTCLNAGDSCAAQTVLISQDNAGVAGNEDSEQVAISSDGRFVAFTSSATNLVTTPAVPSNVQQVYLRDTCNGVAEGTGCTPQTVLISQSSTGLPANSGSSNGAMEPSVEASGRLVIFSSAASNLDPRATSDLQQVYIRDTCGFPPNAIPGCTPTTALAIVNAQGSQPLGSTSQARISPDGRYMVFASNARDLLNGGPVLNGRSQIFVRDSCFGAPTGCVPANTLISIGIESTSGNDDSSFPSISSNDRFIGWNSKATNLNASAQSGVSQAFVRDSCFGMSMCTPTTVLISKNSQGQGANAATGLGQSTVPISTNGAVAAFASSATNLASNSTGHGDIFLTFGVF